MRRIVDGRDWERADEVKKERIRRKAEELESEILEIVNGFDSDVEHKIREKYHIPTGRIPWKKLPPGDALKTLLTEIDDDEKDKDVAFLLDSAQEGAYGLPPELARIRRFANKVYFQAGTDEVTEGHEPSDQKA